MKKKTLTLALSLGLVLAGTNTALATSVNPEVVNNPLEATDKTLQKPTSSNSTTGTNPQTEVTPATVKKDLSNNGDTIVVGGNKEADKTNTQSTQDLVTPETAVENAQENLASQNQENNKPNDETIIVGGNKEADKTAANQENNKPNDETIVVGGNNKETENKENTDNQNNTPNKETIVVGGGNNESENESETENVDPTPENEGNDKTTGEPENKLEDIKTIGGSENEDEDDVDAKKEDADDTDEAKPAKSTDKKEAGANPKTGIATTAAATSTMAIAMAGIVASKKRNK